MAARLEQPSAAALDLQAPQTCISLSGAQDKAAIALFADGVPQLPLGTSPSTHILKPDIKRLAKQQRTGGGPEKFSGLAVFYLYTGNNDGHAKNLSIYRAPGGGIRLTPFYDLMCTRIYPGLSREFAFSIGGEILPGAMTRSHVQQMAQSMGIRPEFVLGLAADMAQRVPAAMEAAIAAVQQDLAPGAKTLALRLQTFVRTTTQQMSKRLLTG